jgi:hypothetical protein
MTEKIIGVFDFVPTYCPNCGKELHTASKLNVQDYLAGCAMSCRECGFQYQLVKTEPIISITDDLKYYYNKE